MSPEAGFVYQQIANKIERLIFSGSWRAGDKLPSIRKISSQYKVSISTALKSYYELESKSLIRARPQSGYFVIHNPSALKKLPEVSQPSLIYKAQPIDNIIHKVYGSVANRNITLFSLGVPSRELLPIPRLNKCLVEAMRKMPASGTEYELAEGNQKLRKLIARRSFQWDGNLSEDSIITTSGGINAVAYCMMAAAKKGDTIAVESPVYFGILKLAQSLGLNVLELPSNPATGIEIDALKDALAKKTINLCLLISNFSNPMGGVMPDEHKKEAVRLLAHYDVPLIEDDLYGDIYFGQSRPRNCKSYDDRGMVMWCSSVSKTIAPGYRVGWVSPGRFFEKIKQIKLYSSMASPGITEEAIALFLETGRYENHLMKMRRKLQTNYLQYLRSIHEYFPHNTKVSRPQGGFVLWLELDRKINTLELYELAIRQKISIAPGRLFTLQKQYDHCLRLSYAMEWTEQLEGSLKLLGKLAKGML